MKFMKLAETLRRDQSALVKSAYERLRDCISDEFQPGYFNSDEVLAAEANGLSVCDAVLGHILASPPNVEGEIRARALLNRVAEALVPSEMENQCHNLHGACTLMLDALGVPVVMVVGSVYATDERGRAFWMNRLVPPAFPGHNPGHAWLLTPWWRVADLALLHQFGVAGDYDEMNRSLRPIITVDTNETLEPEVDWWRFEGRFRLPAEGFAATTKYHDLIGWSQLKLGATTVRYLPSALTLPAEAELKDVSVKIGGLSPKEFFDANVSDLLET
ncbi:MAG: hypothetical protein OXR67_03375 [Chloroflexota bacterium]|nr:hypothetical protein [Chloroflexota bacterium]